MGAKPQTAGSATPSASEAAGISISEAPPATTGNAIAPPPSPDELAAQQAGAAGGSATLSTDAVKLATQAEQAALQAQAQAESEKAKRDREHIEKSYERAANGLLPLAPDQIRTFMHKLERTQEAAVPPSAGTPKGEVRIATLPLDPGVEPPVVNLDAGSRDDNQHARCYRASHGRSSMSAVGGNSRSGCRPRKAVISSVSWPLVRYGTGDLSVLLKDLPTPVIFRLSSGNTSTVDLRSMMRAFRNTAPTARCR